ncbi:hypothetical protein RJ639_009860 [Escallonia herrerae]|uniref:Uncharacterized protein n=1 Tax=Escallonia herrerae TaxID=1293975 RepID=A0AA89AQ68_9ASTE|nr:hypothetical protein RJ639_009860 [Escallonia herrerae]
MATESSSFSGTSSGQESINTGGSEGSVILITKHKLTGHNYHQWAKSVMMFISGKGKDDYLTGTAGPPQKDDLSFRMWKTENNMVMSWLINTMDTEIGQNFLFYDTAYEIWMAAKETYSDNDNTAELFDIKGALHDLRQGEMSQLDGFESLDWECPADASRYKKIIEKERIFKLLLRLDKSLDEPNREKEAQGFVVDSEGTGKTTSDLAFFSKEQVEWLQKMFSSGSSLAPVISTGSTAQKGNFLTALYSKAEDSSDWIIDSGASDNMTGDVSLLHECSPCHENYKVRIVDGSLSTVTGIGKVIISERLILNSVLLVPNLSCNLLSISKITQDLNCVVNFSSTHCLFQDLDSGKMIGNAKESKGLYRIRTDDQQDTRAHHVFLSATNNSGARWFVSFVDDHIRVTWVFLMKDKSEAGSIFKSFHSMIQNQFQAKIQGENSISQEEYQFWDIPTLDIPLTLSESHSQPDIEPSHFDTQLSDPNLIRGGNKELKDKELKVYSRRQTNPKPVEPHMHPEPCQTDVPSSTPTEVIQGNDEEEISKLKQVLSREFEIKDLGTLRYFLGMEVASKKQSVVARSSAEAEFRAMAHGICEGMWLKRLLEELQFPPSTSMKLMCDNKAAISIAKNPVHHDRTKHIEIDRHFIKEKIEQGVIEVDYTPTRQQTADVLTKTIPRGPFDIHLSKLGLIDIHSPA